jgi:hypothetical protein
MKKHHGLASLATCSVIVVLAGCATMKPPVTEDSFREKMSKPIEAPKELSQAMLQDLRALRNLNSNIKEAVAWDEQQHFEPPASGIENFSAIDENGDGQLNTIAFLGYGSNDSKPFVSLGDKDPNEGDFSGLYPDEFQPQHGWPLFSFHF